MGEWAISGRGSECERAFSARAPIGSDDPLNRLLAEVFHILLQFACVAAPILANVHRHPKRDVVALRQVRGRVKKFVTTNEGMTLFNR